MTLLDFLNYLVNIILYILNNSRTISCPINHTNQISNLGAFGPLFFYLLSSSMPTIICLLLSSRANASVVCLIAGQCSIGSTTFSLVEPLNGTMPTTMPAQDDDRRPCPWFHCSMTFSASLLLTDRGPGIINISSNTKITWNHGTMTQNSRRYCIICVPRLMEPCGTMWNQTLC